MKTTTEVSEFADGLFGLALSSSTMSAVQNGIIASGGLNSYLDAIYPMFFGGQSNASIGNTIATNLGLSGSSSTLASTYITQELNVAAPNTQGATIMNILNLFSGLSSDPTFGSFATNWNNEINNSVLYSQTGSANTPIGQLPSVGKTGTTLDISGYHGINDLSSYTPSVSTLNINSSSATASLLNLSSNVTVNDNMSYDNSSLVITHASTVPTNSVTLNIYGGTGYPGVSLNSTGDSTITINTPIGGGHNDIFTISESNNTLKSLVITGGDAIELNGSSQGNVNAYYYFNDSAISDIGSSITVGTTVSSALTKIDASGTTGGVTIDAGGTVGSVSYNGLAIYGGTGGGDYIVNYADNGTIVEGKTLATGNYQSSNNLSVYGSNSSINDSQSTLNDTININGVGDSAVLGNGNTSVNVANALFAYNVTPISGTDVITVGSGIANINDNLTLQTNSNGSILFLNGSINNVNLNMGYVTNQVLGSAVSVSGAASLDAAIMQFTGFANYGKIEWFQYSGNTYIENSGSTYAETKVVKLTGLVDLTHVNIVNNAIAL